MLIRRLLVLISSFAIIVLVATSMVSAKARPRISIDSINIDSSIVEFPISGDTWAIDPWEDNVGHLADTSWFDQPGNVVLAGHSTMPDGSAGVFADLDQLGVGDEFTLFDGSVERVYQVSELRIVSEYDISVIYPTEDARVTLITCETNSFNPDTQTYDNRLVVIANLIG